MLRNHGNDLWVPQENFTHFSRGCLAVFERERGRHGSTNPKVAFFQMWKKFAAKSRCYEHQGSDRKGNFDSDYESTVSERESQRGTVNPVQHSNDYRVRFLEVSREQHGSNYGRDGESRQQSPRQRVAISAGHRAENLTFDALHSEQRHEAGHSDERGE